VLRGSRLALDLSECQSRWPRRYNRHPPSVKARPGSWMARVPAAVEPVAGARGVWVPAQPHEI